MTGHHLSPKQKTKFRAEAERFHRQLEPMFRDLVAFGEGYRALYATSQAITAAYEALDVEKPDRLRIGPIRTMDGHAPFPNSD